MVWSVSEKLHGWNTQNFEIRTEERIPRSEYHHKAAEYLAQEQWKRNPDTIPPPKINPSNLTNGRFPINDSQFTLDELDAVIRKQPNNKAPGTHNLRAELVKYLDEENRKALLQFYNDILQSGKLEDSLHEASVVSIFKKGDSTKSENYRPISLCRHSTNYWQLWLKIVWHKDSTMVSIAANPLATPSPLPADSKVLQRSQVGTSV